MGVLLPLPPSRLSDLFRPCGAPRHFAIPNQTPWCCPCLRSHTHTHTYFFGLSSVNLRFQEFYMQPWTCTEFSRMNMDFLCMCVKFNHLIMDYPLPLPICMPRCELQPNGGSLAIVDVHDWCVSTVLRDFSDGVSMVECAYKRTFMHTHSIHIHSHKQSIMYKHTCKQTKCVCMRVCGGGGGGGGTPNT